MVDWLLVLVAILNFLSYDICSSVSPHLAGSHVMLPQYLSVSYQRWIGMSLCDWGSFTGPAVVCWTANSKVMQLSPGFCFTNDFSIGMQIRWKFRFTLALILIQWSVQNFAHGTTALLSLHVQKFIAIWWSAAELQRGEVSIEFELWAKNHYWDGPLLNLVHRGWKQVSPIQSLSQAVPDPVN